PAGSAHRSLSLRLRAPAKINLTLEVLGRRSDGFHEIRSVVQTISLCDLIEVSAATDLTLVSPSLHWPTRHDLSYRAAERLREALGSPTGATMNRQKRIPISAGLGGGSSDAAAALRLLERLWRVPESGSQIRRVAEKIGSDVCLFLAGGTSLLTGRGERVERLRAPRQRECVLVLPPWDEPGKTA